MGFLANGNFTAAMRYMFARWYDPSSNYVVAAMDNEKDLQWADATNSYAILALRGDLDGRVQLDRGATNGAREAQQFYFAAAGGLVTQAFFINATNHNMVITGVEEIHSTAETASGTATAVVTHDTSGEAPGTGTAVMTNTFNLKGTANTVQSGTLLSTTQLGTSNLNLVLAPGDRLSVLVGGTATITALAGVVLTVFSAPGFKELLYTYNMQANGSIATQTFGGLNRDGVVQSVWMTWSAAGTDSGTVTADCTIDASGVPGGGTSVLAAAQSVKMTANTPVNVPLSATAASLLGRAGNHLSVKVTGTLTALAGLVVTVSVGPVGGFHYMGEAQATFTLKANGSLATQGFFLADRDYEVLEVSTIYSTNAGAADTLDIFIDKGVVAPGGGASCLTSTISLNGSANTTIFTAANAARHLRLLSQGDLMTAKSAAFGTTAGLTVTVSLAPR
jgi:hypothetical protein